MKTAKEILKQTSHTIQSVPENTVIQDVISQMVQNKIGAMLVKEGEKFVGIWTERDLFRIILEPGFDLKTSTVGQYMNRNIVTAPSDTGIEKLQEMFLGLFTRHILITQGKTYLGLLSIGDVMRAELLEKDREIKSLNQIAGWAYYENWGWHHKYQHKKDASKE